MYTQPQSAFCIYNPTRTKNVRMSNIYSNVGDIISETNYIQKLNLSNVLLPGKCERSYGLF